MYWSACLSPSGLDGCRWPLTGIPNVVAGIRLALQDRGSAVVSETFNSNSLNLIVGAYMPTLLVALSASSAEARLSLWWLLAMTLLTAGIFTVRGFLSRRSGLVLIIVYGAFAFVSHFIDGVAKLRPSLSDNSKPPRRFSTPPRGSFDRRFQK